MINIDMLPQVQRLYFHSYCPDGIMARNIMMKYIFKNKPGDFFKAMSAGDKKLTVVDNALFVDCAPSDEQIEEFLSRGALILDHHASRLETYKRMEALYPNRIFYGENELGQSGTALAMTVVDMMGLGSANDKMVAYLSGLADCWLKDQYDFDEARALANFVANMGNSYTDVPDLKVIGPIANHMYRNYKNKLEEKAKQSYLKTMYGYKVYFYNGTNVSDLAELLRTQGADLIVGWQLRNLVTEDISKLGLVVSLRSGNNLDVDGIASDFGGGGHKKAAGFSLVTESSIFEIIEEALKWKQVST